VHKPRYIRKPKKSVVVVRKVELAIAGSNFNFFRVNGIRTPIIDAIVKFKIIAKPIMKPRKMFFLKIKLITETIIPMIEESIKPITICLTNIFQASSEVTSPVANDLTINVST